MALNHGKLRMLAKVLIRNKQGNYVHFGCDQPDLRRNDYEHFRPIPADKGRGFFSSVALRPELGFGVCRGHFNADYNAQVTCERPFVYFGFCLKGQTDSWNTCYRGPLTMREGKSCLYYFEDPLFNRTTCAGQEIFTLVIRVSPQMLRHLLQPEMAGSTRTEDSLETLLQQKNIYAETAMTTVMKGVLRQMILSVHRGSVGRLYLESKVLELISLQIGQLIPGDGANAWEPDVTSRLNLDDQSRIYQARDILLQKLQYPPTLSDLARQVNMSHTRLNRGFKAVFGCTVFEYLRKERLAYARLLIREKETDLTSIAFKSGFSSSSHFAASFFKEFGIRPSDYRKSLHGVQ